ncbi:MAG: hypothetical protein ACXWQ5_00075 [Ktedonobacterales bacterium]
MGYIVDSGDNDDWSVELLSESTVIEVGESDITIDDKHLLNVLKALLEASIEVAERNRQEQYLRSLIENFMVRLISNG